MGLSGQDLINSSNCIWQSVISCIFFTLCILLQGVSCCGRIMKLGCLRFSFRKIFWCVSEIWNELVYAYETACCGLRCLVFFLFLEISCLFGCWVPHCEIWIQHLQVQVYLVYMFHRVDLKIIPTYVAWCIYLVVVRTWSQLCTCGSKAVNPNSSAYVWRAYSL